MVRPKRKVLRKVDIDPASEKKVAQPVLGNDIQTGEHSSVRRLLPWLDEPTALHNSQNRNRKRIIEEMRDLHKPQTKGLWDLVLESESVRKEVANPELKIRTGEYSNVCLFRSSSHRSYLDMTGYKSK